PVNRHIISQTKFTQLKVQQSRAETQKSPSFRQDYVPMQARGRGQQQKHRLTARTRTEDFPNCTSPPRPTPRRRIKSRPRAPRLSSLSSPTHQRATKPERANDLPLPCSLPVPTPLAPTPAMAMD
uniref:Uncharacterized protein n=1 Tax=Aegilops tauschii subsp. strangulata TaxID=200361 RepID=A0A453DT70_AEGTS